MENSYNILIVDDVSDNIKVAMSILKNDDYSFSYALNGESAIEILKTKRFDLLLLDVMMPGIDGFHLCKIIKNSPAIKDMPIIFVTAKVDINSIANGFKLGAVDYVTKPFHPLELKSRVENHLELYRYRKQLSKNNENLKNEIKDNHLKHFSELELAQKEIIDILSEIMDSSHVNKKSTVKKVAYLARYLGTLTGVLDKNEINMLYLAAPLHDVGQIMIDKKILNKPGKLTPQEYELVKRHPTYAFNILKSSKRELIKACAVIAHEHHENFDGSGYPMGKNGNGIHIFGRIVAIADMLNALTNERPYAKAISFEEAIKQIISLSGTKFDPILVRLVQKNLDGFRKIVAS